jgi:NAD(P)-dependent dehydrogenase (short-subunit alcohol dehydrogenase family)
MSDPAPRPFPDLAGRTVVITGGSRGLGREMVLGFARSGANVVVASRKLDACEQVARAAEGYGVRALPVACHVGRWGDCDRLVETVYAEFDRVDVLINNAGMSPLYPSLGEVSEELFDKVVSVNLKGAFRLTAAIGERMRDAGGGSVINISSVTSLSPGPAELPYASAKAGLNALTVGLAEAYAPKVRVNAILPGPFRTDISKAWAPPEGADVPWVPLGRIGVPAEIAPLALHLASAASSFTTGAIIRVDGGLTGKV